MAGKLFVVSGPSGVGKGTLLSKVLPQLENIYVAVSATTRLPRSGETDGIHYIFLADEEFDRLISTDGLLEWATVHGARYGTLRSEVDKAVMSGLDVILEIDPQGARQIKQSYPAAVLIFIDPPSLEMLRQRLIGRGTESEDQVELRIAAAAVELNEKPLYDRVIVNDDLDRAAGEFITYISEMRSD